MLKSPCIYQLLSQYSMIKLRTETVDSKYFISYLYLFISVVFYTFCHSCSGNLLFDQDLFCMKRFTGLDLNFYMYYQWAYASGRSLSHFCSMKQLEVFLLLPGIMGCYSIAGLPRALNLPVPIYTPGQSERSIVRVKRLA